MEQISHRTLRNDSSRILARVKAGETFEITNHGDVVAVLSPPQVPEQRLGTHHSASRSGGFRAIQRIRSEASTEEILADLRGDR